MRRWAAQLITYPVVLVLALIFIGPTLPIDVSILIITSLVALLGLSKKPHVVLGIRPYFAEWGRQFLLRLKR